MRTRRPAGSHRGGGGGGSGSHLCTRGRCHLHPLLPGPHLRSEGLLKLEDFLDVFSLLFPGGAALAVLPGHGRRGRRAQRAARRSGRGRGGPGWARKEGAPERGGAGGAAARAQRGRRRRRAGPGGLGWRRGDARRGSRRRLCAAAELPLLQFPLSLSPPPRSLPGSYFCASRAQTSCRRRHSPGSFAAGCQPHFLLLSCLPSPPSQPPALLPPSSSSSRGLPALPARPGRLPPPRLPRAAAFGDVLLPGNAVPRTPGHRRRRPATLPAAARALEPRRGQVRGTQAGAGAQARAGGPRPPGAALLIPQSQVSGARGLSSPAAGEGASALR